MSEYVLAKDKIPKDGQLIDIWDLWGGRFIDCTFKRATVGVRAHVVMREQDLAYCDELTFDYVHSWKPADVFPGKSK